MIAAVLHRPYQMQRISGFLETWADWTEAPYHLKQSLVTLGAGGIWGVGLGKGFQKLSFLPEANTDFVFAVIGEELGLLGVLSVIGLWLGVYVLGLRLLRHVERETFAYNAAFVLLTQLIVVSSFAQRGGGDGDGPSQRDSASAHQLWRQQSGRQSHGDWHHSEFDAPAVARRGSRFPDAS